MRTIGPIGGMSWLGCTEIGLLVKPGDSRAPLLATTTLHASAAVDFALAA